jgi:uncharacterized protein
MKMIRLGRTELQVSELGFGGIPIIPHSLADGVAMVRYAFDRGINFFDTANMYGDSEKKMADCWKTPGSASNSCSNIRM